MTKDRNELFELVFEGLDRSAAEGLARDLGHSLQPLSEGDGVQEVSVEELDLGGGAVLHDAHLRFLRYDGVAYDVEVNFKRRQAEAASSSVLIAALFDFAAKLAEANGVETYFAGLEPASDEETRIFTGREKGPYYALV